MQACACSHVGVCPYAWVCVQVCERMRVRVPVGVQVCERVCRCAQVWRVCVWAVAGTPVWMCMWGRGLLRFGTQVVTHAELYRYFNCHALTVWIPATCVGTKS